MWCRNISSNLAKGLRWKDFLVQRDSLLSCTSQGWAHIFKVNKLKRLMSEHRLNKWFVSVGGILHKQLARKRRFPYSAIVLREGTWFRIRACQLQVSARQARKGVFARRADISLSAEWQLCQKQVSLVSYTLTTNTPFPTPYGRIRFVSNSDIHIFHIMFNYQRWSPWCTSESYQSSDP